MKSFTNSSLEQFVRFLLTYLLPGFSFLVFFLYVFDQAFTEFILFKTEGPGYNKIYRLINNENEDIPIFGASRARTSYVPDTTGISVFNYGLDDASFLTTHAFLNIELKKKKKSPIILDVVYWDWFNIGDPADYIPFSQNEHIKQMLRDAGEYKMIFSIPGLRYYGYYPHYIRLYFNQVFRSDQKVINGYVFENKDTDFDSKIFNEALDKRLNKSQNLGIDERRSGSYDQRQKDMLIEHIRNHPERHFFLIISPFHRSFFKTKPDIKKGELFFKYASTFPNVTFLNLAKSDYPDSLFLNTTHLNHQGAVRFSKNVFNIIKDIH
jgi:hypothetical protein